MLQDIFLYQHQTYYRFGSLLKALREQAGLSQQALAKQVNYCPSYICRLERGDRLPNIAIIRRLFVSQLGLAKQPEIAAHLVALAARELGRAHVELFTLDL